MIPIKFDMARVAQYDVWYMVEAQQPKTHSKHTCRVRTGLMLSQVHTMHALHGLKFMRGAL